MNKLKYLSPILFVVFFLVSKTNIAQVTDSKPTLRQALKEVFSESKTSKKPSKIEGEKPSPKIEKKVLTSNYISKDSKKVESKNTKKKKVKKTTLKSRKGSSDLMNALRKAFKK